MDSVGVEGRAHVGCGRFGSNRVVMAAVVVARDAAADLLIWAVETWNSFALWVQGLFR